MIDETNNDQHCSHCSPPSDGSITALVEKVMSEIESGPAKFTEPPQPPCPICGRGEPRGISVGKLKAMIYERWEGIVFPPDSAERLYQWADEFGAHRVGGWIEFLNREGILNRELFGYLHFIATYSRNGWASA